MGEPSVEIDIIFVGQTGVGKSSLINMIISAVDWVKIIGQSIQRRPSVHHTYYFLFDVAGHGIAMSTLGHAGP
ncbi:hypothetical protein JVT61DRAFT_4401 [Boletus reticuloceps]|uniref:G domain-containing protein n=1 Tax=Boletus reticuloceps TaxID=495285 RepID=A0A8I2YLZ2_9AGAM|nr:hypothetical protein JVT61DRAFT_4401 [Boletus reticuloceps]